MAQDAGTVTFISAGICLGTLMDTGSQVMPRQQASGAMLLARAMKKYGPGLAWQKWRAPHLEWPRLTAALIAAAMLAPLGARLNLVEKPPVWAPPKAAPSPAVTPARRWQRSLLAAKKTHPDSRRQSTSLDRRYRPWRRQRPLVSQKRKPPSDERFRMHSRYRVSNKIILITCGF